MGKGGGVGRMLVAALWCVALAPAPARALRPDRGIAQYVHDSWQDPLPQGTVLSIVQTRDGFLWFTTYEGLVRFDGADFAVFDRRNVPAFETVAFSALAEDAEGDLWCGTIGGGLYRYRDGTFTRVRVPGLGDSVYTLHAAPNGGPVWAGANRGLGRLEKGVWRVLGPADGVPARRLRAIATAPDGDTFVATDGEGLVRIHDGRVSVLRKADGLPSDVLYSLAAGRDGTLWVGTEGGLVAWREGRISVPPFAAALGQTAIISMIVDRDGNLWSSSESAGLCRVAGRGASCEDRSGEGTSDLLRTMTEDREGSLWMGGTSNGLHRLRDGTLATFAGSALASSVRSVTVDPAGTVWAGTEGGGLATVREGRLVPWQGNAKLPSAFIRSVRADAGGLWVGTLRGLARVEGGSVTSYRARDGLASELVYTTAAGRDGTTWIGTSAGLSRMRGGAIATVDAGPEVEDVRALHEDAGGRLWIGMRAGLACLEGGRLAPCAADAALRHATVFSFLEEPGGTMWVGTSSGITRVRDGVARTYTTRDGLFDDVAFEILDDGESLWTSSNRGIARTRLRDFARYDAGKIPAIRSTSFGRSDGMLSAQCNGASGPAGWKSADGRLWFATTRGVVEVEPKRLGAAPAPPPVVIESLQVNDRGVGLRAPLALGPGVRRLEIRYAALTFLSPEKVRFRFRLEGFDPAWVDAGARRAAYFTGVPAGDYVFRVVTAGADGSWSPAGASVAFSVRPRVWETVWFRALLALALGGALYGIHRLRVWRLARRERELMRLVDERTEELRTSNAELTRLAAVDGLTRIANRTAFDAALARMWSEHKRRRAPMALLLVDIDHFKHYNDSYGHQLGDAALVRVAQAIESAARRATDAAARYGGEEFVLLLGDATLEKAMAIARGLVESVRALAIPHAASGSSPVVTISVGVASDVPSDKSSAAVLLARADAALYRAKAAGRDRAVPCNLHRLEETA